MLIAITYLLIYEMLAVIKIMSRVNGLSKIILPVQHHLSLPQLLGILVYYMILLVKHRGDLVESRLELFRDRECPHI